jgi:hypothetical protein
LIQQSLNHGGATLEEDEYDDGFIYEDRDVNDDSDSSKRAARQLASEPQQQQRSSQAKRTAGTPFNYQGCAESQIRKSQDDRIVKRSIQETKLY